MERIWGEIRNDFEENGVVSIDAWVTPDDNEEGTVIAKVRLSDGAVEYLDDRAIKDKYAQEMIMDALIPVIGNFDKNGDIKF